MMCYLRNNIYHVYNFDEFVQYGRDHGANIVNGMPWSFLFHGIPATHENDRDYIICGDGRSPDIRLTPGHVVVVGPIGAPTLMTEVDFAARCVRVVEQMIQG